MSWCSPYEQRRVYAAALAILRNEHDAEDAAQEAMLKAFANIRQFRAEARFSTWLIQITVNEALMRRRRERTVPMEGLDDRRDEEAEYAPRDFADWREIPSEALELKKKCGSVWRRNAGAHCGSKVSMRSIRVLRDMEHLNIQETTEALGIATVSFGEDMAVAGAADGCAICAGAAGWEQGWFRAGCRSRRNQSHGSEHAAELLPEQSLAGDSAGYVDGGRGRRGAACVDGQAIFGRAGSVRPVHERERRM